jgi:hypothetical protein
MGTLVVIGVVLFVVIVVLAIASMVLRARGTGVESVVTMRTDDMVDQAIADEHVSHVADGAVSDEGVVAGQAFPEPQGDPPVPGAQWDEVHGSWMVWDEAANAWQTISETP